MNSLFYLANTDFESELEKGMYSSLKKKWEKNALFLQLQFLPLLYANDCDSIGVSHFPPAEYLEQLLHSGWIHSPLPSLILLDNVAALKGKKCISWGPSPSLYAWTQKQGIEYSIPGSIKILRKLNSKAFSLRYSGLEKAQLLHNEEELKTWMDNTPGEKVIKGCFGLSGQGNRRVENSLLTPLLLAFCQKEWQQHGAVVGEPWVHRVLDFSTQWFIHPMGPIEFLGSTRFSTDPSGVYQGTLAGPEALLFKDYLSLLEVHKEKAKEALKEMQKEGYFGHVGIDAFLYLKEGNILRLNPVVEINGRQTMSWVALKLQQKIAPNGIVDIFFGKKEAEGTPLLPTYLELEKGKKVFFKHQLTAKSIDSFD